MAEDLSEKQKYLLESLNELKMNKEKRLERLAELNNEIRQKIDLHNKLISSISNMKKNYKEKVQKFGTLRKLVKEYKTDQKEMLEKEYKKQILRAIEEINQLNFSLKLSVFKAFDSLKAIDTSLFPILNIKKTEFINIQRSILKKRIFNEINLTINNESKIADLVFYINFIIKYELYFEESVFIPFFIKKIEKEFEYHFLSDKETNRLDKPEWFLEFLTKKYTEYENIIQIYSDCRIKNNLSEKNITEIVIKTQHLVLEKLIEISKLESTQQRNLMLNFISKYKDYTINIMDIYSISLNIDEISHILSTIQSNYIKTELIRIHELKYVQWSAEYKRLCKDSLFYTYKYGKIDKKFKFKDLINQIINHTRNFIDNLRFINREEIRVVSFIFSELEELKKYILEEVSELSLSFSYNGESDIESSIDKITIFNSDVFKLIKKLAVNDVENSLNKIIYFTYSSNEIRRTVIVELIRIIGEYKGCIYSDLVEKAMQERADQFIFDEFLLKIRFSSDEYLEFRGFYRSLKKIFPEFLWKSDDACKCVDAIFEERTETGQLFKSISSLYNR